MKFSTLLTIAILIGALAAALALFWHLRVPPVSPAVAPVARNSFPISQNAPAHFATATSSDLARLSLATTVDDLNVSTLDFKTGTGTVRDAQNPNRYYLIGGAARAATNASYGVAYDDSDQSFTLTLYKEPLGANRIAAEQAIMTTLGVSARDLCLLYFKVVVAPGVNVFYDGKDLGLSVCPRPIPLPQ